MKRKSKAYSDPCSANKHPRQDPVSCESCRKKKLKCSRNIPCSSCEARNINCSFEEHLTSTTKPVAKRGIYTERPRLYNPVVSQRQQLTSEAEPRSRNRDDPLVTVDRLETMLMSYRVPSVVTSSSREELSENSRAAVAEATLDFSSVSFLSGHNFLPSRENPAKIQISSFLPSEADAMDLFQFYSNYLDYQYHIIIPSYTRRDIEAIYDINSTSDLSLPHVALLFAIVATALYHKLISTKPAGIAEASSCEAAFLAGAALIQGNYVACPSIEGLQAAMIIGHHLSITTLNPSVNSLFLHGSMVSQAKCLGLHLVDSSFSKVQVNGKEGRTKVELKRRLWWDLASYDWLIGFLSGPQEWTYTISPQQMIVRRPWNIEDEDIETSKTELPVTEPTCMSYTLQRLRLAELCREIVDKTALDNLQSMEIAYDKILYLDRKLHDAYAEIPAFFRFDQSSQHKFSSLYREKPAIAWQRSLLQQGYHSRFCRLHRQYLVRGAKDHKYSYSHVVSLQSARKVLELKRMMDEEEPIFAPSSAVFWAVHHVFMAAVILLIDVCFNWDDILAEKRKEEVLAACRMLSRAQQSSLIAREGINAMMEILRKHWKKERRQCHLTAAPHQSPDRSPLQNLYTEEDTQNEVAGQNSCGGSDFGQIPLENIWSEMLDRNEDTDWMNLLLELTNINCT